MRTGVKSAMLVTVVFAICGLSQAQFLTPLHGFSYSGADGGYPLGGLSQDAAGNLYGTTSNGGNIQCFEGTRPVGCGAAFKLARHGFSWVFQTLYEFGAQPDAGIPMARVVVGPDGNLYGTTSQGGTGSCSGYHGCGTVFKLQPPANFCGGVSCRWTETILYSFSSTDDGYQPMSDLYFDHAGNLYGTTSLGGGGSNCQNGNGCGEVFELTPNHNGTWTKSTIHVFQGGASDGHYPLWGVVVDQAGNVYGTTSQGGTGNCGNQGCGIVFELTPSGSGWTESVLYNFTNETDGYNPGQLTFDGSGNLWGTAQLATLFELTPQVGGGWQFSVQFSFEPYDLDPNAVTIDASGNIYGTLQGAGGEIYRLTRSGSGWNFTILYIFGFGNQNQGYTSVGTLVLDSQGNLYGENEYGDEPPYGTVWEFTP